jgi:hypothetical protein
MEAVGFYEWIYDHLEDLGHDVALAHPYKVRAIAEARIKTDKVDARTLAHLLRADLLPRSYVPPPEIRRLRALVGERVHLTRTMTRTKNRIRHELHRRGLRPPMESLFGTTAEPGWIPEGWRPSIADWPSWRPLRHNVRRSTTSWRRSGGSGRTCTCSRRFREWAPSWPASW